MKKLIASFIFAFGLVFGMFAQPMADVEDILNEVKELAQNGYREITLLGQNVNSYGKDLENPITFANLLEKVAKIDGIERIRFVSPHPKDFSDELIELIAKE